MQRPDLFRQGIDPASDVVRSSTDRPNTGIEFDRTIDPRGVVASANDRPFTSGSVHSSLMSSMVRRYRPQDPAALVSPGSGPAKLTGVGLRIDSDKNFAMTPRQGLRSPTTTEEHHAHHPDHHVKEPRRHRGGRGGSREAARSMRDLERKTHVMRSVSGGDIHQVEYMIDFDSFEASKFSDAIVDGEWWTGMMQAVAAAYPDLRNAGHA